MVVCSVGLLRAGTVSVNSLEVIGVVMVILSTIAFGRAKVVGSRVADMAYAAAASSPSSPANSPGMLITVRQQSVYTVEEEGEESKDAAAASSSMAERDNGFDATIALNR